MRIAFVIASLTFLGTVFLGIAVWAHRPAQSAPFPGYAWVATSDGTTTAATTRVTAALRRHGIPSVYDSMLSASYYVPTNQVARARLVLTLEKLKHWDLIWSIE